MKQVNPDSFSAKLWLLVLDKLVIGAIVFGVFAGYKQWETDESRKYNEPFTRAEYIKELVPIVLDNDNEPQVRAYTLGALVDTQSVSPESAVYFAAQLFDRRRACRGIRLPREHSLASDAARYRRCH